MYIQFPLAQEDTLSLKQQQKLYLDWYWFDWVTEEFDGKNLKKKRNAVFHGEE